MPSFNTAQHLRAVSKGLTLRKLLRDNQERNVERNRVARSIEDVLKSDNVFSAVF